MCKILLLLLVLLGLFSCKKNEKKSEIEKTVAEWIGKEIKFPSGYNCNSLGSDTTTILCENLLHKEYKILLYIDSLGCISCKLKLFEWKQLMQEADSIFPGNQLGFLFFFYPKNEKELKFMFKRDRFEHPVFIDKADQINSLNHFLDKQSYQCFLLDKDNKVLMIGNPVLNPKIWELYKEQISGKAGNNDIKITTIETDKTVYDFGTVKVSAKNEALFTIRNTGTQALSIQHVSTSCGCTSVEYDKQPIESGKITIIKVEMTPEETGYFNKAIEVYGNFGSSPVKLTITGMVTAK